MGARAFNTWLGAVESVDSTAAHVQPCIACIFTIFNGWACALLITDQVGYTIEELPLDEIKFCEGPAWEAN